MNMSVSVQEVLVQNMDLALPKITIFTSVKRNLPLA